MTKNDDLTTMQVSFTNLRKLSELGKAAKGDTWNGLLGRVLEDYSRLKKMEEYGLDCDMR